MVMGMEVELELVRNSKAARIKPWVAKIILERGDIEFLRPIEEVRAKNGILVSGTFEFENDNFYIIASDNSSHKNPEQIYSLVLCENDKIKEIASIVFTRGKSFGGESDEVVQKLKEIYKRQENGRKVINSLIKLAQWYASKHNIQHDKKQLILEEVQKILEKYSITPEELLEIIKSNL